MVQRIRIPAGNKWVAAVSGVIILSFAGAPYAFSLYSPAFKSSLAYDQKAIATAGFFKVLGGNFGILSGPIYDWKGPKLALCVGAALNALGYLIVLLQVKHQILEKEWLMYLGIFVAANAQTFITTAVLATIAKNFQRKRAIALGWATAYLGLSGAILPLLYQALCGGDSPDSFILIILLIPSIVWLWFLFDIKVYEESDGNWGNTSFILHLLLLAGYILIVLIVQFKYELGQPADQVFAAIMLLLVFSPLVLVDYSEHAPEPETEHQKQREAEEGSVPSPLPIEILTEEHPKYVPTSNMVLIFLATACCGGAAMAASDNGSQLGDSLGSQINFLISISNVFNCLGRIGSVGLSQILLQKYGFPRPFFAALISLVSSTGLALIAWDPFSGALHIGFVMVVTCLGGQWATMSNIISELFDLHYYGTLYNVAGFANVPGSYLLSVQFAGNYYDKEARRQHSRMCHGIICFRKSFFIMAIFSAFGSLLYSLLGFLNMKSYKTIARHR